MITYPVGIEDEELVQCVCCEEYFIEDQGVDHPHYFLCSDDCKKAKIDDDNGQANW